MYPEPSAPPLDFLNDTWPEAIPNELDSCSLLSQFRCAECFDVEFLVGEQDVRIPAHSRKLEEYPFFQALLSPDISQSVQDSVAGTGVLNQGQKVRMSSDCRAFKNVLRFINGNQLLLQSTEEATETLKAAKQFHICQMIPVITKQIWSLVTRENVHFVQSKMTSLCNEIVNLVNIINTGLDGSQYKLSDTDLLNQNANICIEQYLLCVLAKCLGVLETLSTAFTKTCSQSIAFQNV